MMPFYKHEAINLYSHSKASNSMATKIGQSMGCQNREPKLD